MRLALTLLPLVALALFTACTELPHESPFDSLSPASKQAASRMQGAVVLEGESDFGQVAIELINDLRTYSVATRNDGTFEITGIEPGEYTLRMTARSFEPVEDSLEVPLGAALALGTTSLAAKKTTLTGVAQVEKLIGGEPVAVGGVAVILQRSASIRGASAAPRYRIAGETAHSPALTFATVSAADGSYALNDIPPGVYVAKAEADNASPANLGELTVTGESGPMELPSAVLKPLTGFFDIEVAGQINPAFTASADVTLKLVGLNATEMAINVVRNDAACLPLVRETLDAMVTLPLAGEGLNRICVRYFDESGNQTEVLERSITRDMTPPSVAAFLINNGAAASNDLLGTVILNLVAGDAASGLVSMKLANRGTAATCADALVSAPEEPFVTTKTWTLQAPADDSSRTICLSLADRAGNWSSAYDASILWDTAAPVAGSPAILVNGGKPWALTTQVELALLATGATEMQLANNGVFGGAGWEPYRATSFWVLPNVQGVHTVNVNYRDAAGNVSGPFAATITLDTVRPTAPSLSIDGGAPYATEPDVTLTLAAGGATVMQISSDGVFDNEPVEAFAPVTSFTLPGADGTKFVYARFGDDAGNYTDPIAALIILDRLPPEGGTFLINNGAAYTNDANVTLTLSASGATGMYLSTAGCLLGSVWIGYMPSLSYNLGAGTGFRTLYVNYRDDAGNPSVCQTAQITYDNKFEAPSFAAIVTGPELLAGRTRSLNVWVTLSGLTADVAEVALSADPSFSGAAWLPAATQLPWVLSGGDGVRTVYVRGRDAAGNLSATLSSSISLDQTGPEVPAISVADIDGDGFAVSQTQVELRWTAPSDMALAGFEIERYVPGYSAGYVQIFSSGAGTVTFADAVTDDTGVVHFYRVRAADNLGNFSGWSASIQAYPFAPIQQAAWIKNNSGLRYLFTPNRGTFSQRASRTYENLGGIEVGQDLGIDITSWAHPGTPGEFAENLILRASNQDNSLAYESVYGTPLPRRERIGEFLQSLDMARDSVGNPHILTCGWMRLIYGINADEAFLNEDLPIAEPCMQVALTLDGDDNAHILYTLQYSPYSVIYMSNASGSWISEEVTDATFFTIQRPGIGVAADGTVHAMWDDQGMLHYAQRSSSGTWSKEAMFSGTGASLAVDAVGTPHVAYGRVVGASWAIAVARRTGPSTWSEMVVDTAAGFGEETSLRFDHADVMHLAYQAPGRGSLMYAEGPALLPVTAAAGDPHHFAMLFDDVGNPYIGYADFTADQAKVAYFDGIWREKTLGNISGGGMSTDYVLGVPDGRGNFHAVFSQYSSANLMYYYEQADRIAEIPTDWAMGFAMLIDNDDRVGFMINHFADGGKPYFVDNTTGTWVQSGPLYSEQVFEPVLAADHLGRMHAAFRSYSDNIVYALRETDGVWSTQVIASASFAHALALDQDGKRVIVYSTQAGAMMYATAASTGNFSAAQQLGNGGYAQMIAGGDGVIHLVYFDFDEGATKYRSYSGGNWSTAERVAAGYNAMSLTERNGQIWVAHLNQAAETLNMSARKVDGTWTTQLVDRNLISGIDTPSIAVSPEGWVAILYEDRANSRMKLATNATGGWSTAIIGPSYGFGRLALDSRGNPQMAYTGLSDENYRLHYVRNFFGMMPLKSTSRVSAW